MRKISGLRLTNLFLSGFFFGGAVDHFILAVLGSPLTAYGIQTGVGGNWLLGLLDLFLAAVGYILFKRERPERTD